MRRVRRLIPSLLIVPNSGVLSTAFHISFHLNLYDIIFKLILYSISTRCYLSVTNSFKRSFVPVRYHHSYLTHENDVLVWYVFVQQIILYTLSRIQTSLVSATSVCDISLHPVINKAITNTYLYIFTSFYCNYFSNFE